MKVDFIAYHDLQAQVGQSTFDELLKLGHDCEWHINPGQSFSADAIIMMDHSAHHPNLQSKYKFHIPHDMGELEVYSRESWFLREYDAVFTPTKKHQLQAEKHLPWCEAEYIGWPKYDTMKPLDIPLDNEIIFIYAPSYVETFEWEKVFEWVKDSDAGLIVKNHILSNPGQKIPAGWEALYERRYKSLYEMEAAAAGMRNAVVLPRTTNLCDTFKKGRILISDMSSALPEFTPFGVSLETGRHDSSINVIAYNSKLFSGIYFVCDDELKATIRSPEVARNKIACHTVGDVEFRQDNGKRIAEYMDKYFRRVKK